ncbi:MAG: rhodanese-like domain-containing protein [Planctomycetes bacterium]|nr:rhodanese-like domain-containing protein [Planctomycetota bacterium]MCB9936130.1 rhodanese-like domain-containing protein [Planctomycetota bacterium]
MRNSFQLAALLALLLALAACSGKVRHDFGGGGSDAEVLILRDSPAVELSIWEGAIVFDLREYDQWAQGHVQGARHSSLEDLDRGRGLPQDREAPLLFMGEGPMDTRPEQAADIALKRGHSNVQIFPGGWRMWVDAHNTRE